jgi:hypothetical protein
MPWAFTQNQPLDTAHFIGQAKRRGVDLDLSPMRELYRYQLLVPFVSIAYWLCQPDVAPPLYFDLAPPGRAAAGVVAL